jgi:lysophospholipase L1-like esterase
MSSKRVALVARAGMVVLVASLLLAGCALNTTTTLSSSASTVTAGQPVTFTATVSAFTTPTGAVSFWDGSTQMGSVTLAGGVGTFTTSALSVGTHQVTAQYLAQSTWGPSYSSTVTDTVLAAGARYYLALGDSLAVGVGGSPGHGYVADILAAERARLPGLLGQNLACSGATTTSMLSGGGCTYPQGTQTAAAVAFLQSHPGQVAFITIDIGANDISGCFAGGVIDQACAQAKVAVVQTNLASILSQLRSAGGSVPVVGMTYYDPFLAYWVAGNQAAATQSQQATASGNAVITAVYTAAGAQVGDVQGAFDSANYNLTGTYNATMVPQNVANICAWTQMCTSSDIHPNDMGHQVIATTLEPLIDTAVPR